MANFTSILTGKQVESLLANYATCATAGDAAAKVATISSMNGATPQFELFKGLLVRVKFTNSNTAANPTLNVNGTGAKSIVRYGTTAVGNTIYTSWSDGAIISLTYDGTNWVMNDNTSDITGVIQEELTTKLENLLDLIYPIGAIYLSVNNTSPASLFGGTWEQIKDKFLLAAGNTYKAGSTGGEAKHTLTKSEMPSVAGEIVTHGVYSGTPIAAVAGCFSAKATVSNKYLGGTTSGANSISNIKFDNGGEDAAHNNMPPYLAVYMWKRIA